MFYTIYQITNLVNNKIYIGLHKTKNLDDGYMGSGKMLGYAIKKHGLGIFKKEILFIFDNEKDMISKEIELVTEEFCLRKDTYNLAKGGGDGFSYANRMGLSKNTFENVEIAKRASKIGNERIKELSKDENWRNKHSQNTSSGMKKYHENNPNSFAGKKHSEEWKFNHSEKMKIKASGIGNSQYGTRWIHSLEEKRSTRISKEALLPISWFEGRKMKFD